MCKTIVGRLSAAIAQQSDVGVQLEALDILCDLLSRFGGLLINYHPSLLEALYPQVSHHTRAIRIFIFKSILKEKPVVLVLKTHVVIEIILIVYSCVRRARPSGSARFSPLVTW